MSKATLEQALGYRFARPELLARALTHRSHSAEHNERLEFLGDSVLNCCIAKYLYEHHPELPEGELSRLRAHLVNQRTLAGLAQQLGLGERLALGEGERKSAGQRRPSILGDALEAVFGAVMLDGGFAAAEAVVLKLYLPWIAALDLKTLGKDAKTLLQEYLQGRKLPLPHYAVLQVKGEAHAQTFEVSCTVEKLGIVTYGSGPSRRMAEQMAAAAAYRKMTS